MRAHINTIARAHTRGSGEHQRDDQHDRDPDNLDPARLITITTTTVIIITIIIIIVIIITIVGAAVDISARICPYLPISYVCCRYSRRGVALQQREERHRPLHHRRPFPPTAASAALPLALG
jgi:hypothetical protein